MLACVACAADRTAEVTAPDGAATREAPSALDAASAEPASPEPTPPAGLDLVPSRLAIPSVGIDAPVQLS